MSIRIPTVIVATHYKGDAAVAAIESLAKGVRLELRREPENIHDSSAVAVYCGEQHIGYVPRTHNGQVARMLDAAPGSIIAEVRLGADIANGKVRKAPKIMIKDR